MKYFISANCRFSFIKNRDVVDKIAAQLSFKEAITGVLLKFKSVGEISQIQILFATYRKLKSCLRYIADLRWLEPLAMVPDGDKFLNFI